VRHLASTSYGQIQFRLELGPIWKDESETPLREDGSAGPKSKNRSRSRERCARRAFAPTAF
jgi:hypothetical protein